MIILQVDIVNEWPLIRLVVLRVLRDKNDLFMVSVTIVHSPADVLGVVGVGQVCLGGDVVRHGFCGAVVSSGVAVWHCYVCHGYGWQRGWSRA
jgi:hypothetical protein